MSARYRGRLGLQQRVLPNYRVPFFDMLAAACDGGLSLFAGQPRPDEGIVTAAPRLAHYSAAANVHILGGDLYLCHQGGLRSWLEAWDPDALIVEANARYLATPSAVRWMHARGRRVIGWGLGAPPLTGLLGGLRQARRRRFLGQFDALIAYSRRGAREYAAAGFPLQRVFVATNSVAPRPSRKPDREPPADQATILFVGRLQARKHVDALLRACAEMPQPQPRLVIVGDGPERGRLESLARQAFPAAEFTGAKHGDELDPYFLQADLFVLPGTGGLAVQEAMARGLPVIVARGDGTQDDLVREGNGWQIPPEDYPALVNTLRLALADVGKLRSMGDESLRIVSEEVNLESMVESFVGALNVSS
ncbi:MAG: glycosyltransferase family 4 protein [Chloroflexota bacterium]